MAQGTTLAFSGDLTLANAIALAGDPTFDVESGQVETLTGTITDTSGVLEKTGGGTLVPDGSDSYAGGTALGTLGQASPPPPDSVMLEPDPAFLGHGIFELTGTVSSPAGVKSVEISAEVDGVETDLGSAMLNPRGSFTFKDHVGAPPQRFITAIETDDAGGTASMSEGRATT